MAPFNLAPREAKEVVFVLGQADTPEKVRHLVTTYTAAGKSSEVLRAVQHLWDGILGAVQVRHPTPQST